MAHFLALNNILPPDEWAIKYEENIDYIMRSHIIVFIIPYISLLLKDRIKSYIWGHNTSIEDINIYKNKYEKELLEYDYDYVIVPNCDMWELINF